jgi:CRP/FNR family cyclic AMP-dependent transcriptional regulator
MSLLGRNCPVFEMLDPEDAAALLHAGISRHYRPGDVMMSEGDTTAFVLVLRTGHAMVALTTEQGGRLILAIRGPGDIVGELSAIDGSARSATVTALVGTDAVLVPGDWFHEALTRSPALSRAVMRAIGGRLRDADAQRRKLAAAPLLQRVAQALTELVDRTGRPVPEGTMIDLPLPQHELAALVGATREGTAKALRMLRESGIVRTLPRRILITDRDLLRAIGDL